MRQRRKARQDVPSAEATRESSTAPIAPQTASQATDEPAIVTTAANDRHYTEETWRKTVINGSAPPKRKQRRKRGGQADAESPAGESS